MLIELKNFWLDDLNEIHVRYLNKYECDLTLLKNVPISDLTSIPVFNLDCRDNLDKTIEIYPLRTKSIADISGLVIRSITVHTFNEVLDNPIYDNSLIEKAWAAIIVEEVHKS
jgi:hypothetical protein